MPRNRAARIISVADAQRRARRVIPRLLTDYIEGGAEDELTLAENVRAFQELGIRPRMGVDFEPDITTTVLGTRVELPVLLAPSGMIQLIHPDGGVGVARAAAAAGTISVLSRTAMCSPREVAAGAPGPHWFQITSAGGRDAVRRLMDTAAEAGFQGLVVTMDGPPPGNREGELRHGVAPPVRPSKRLAAHIAGQMLARPRWLASMAPSLRRQLAALSGASSLVSSGVLHGSARFTWADVEWMKREWAGHVLVKGVLTGSDALAARDSGADAIIVSNHGGRSLDGVPATIRALPEVVAAVGPTTEVFLDGGVRRATCVVKALSLGARAVFVGRPFVYGLAAAGEPGVARILDLFRSELVRTLRLMGCPGVADLNPGWLQLPPPREVPAALPQ
ncbi:(S)-2-hydroxy-acid oxidase [Actinobacteria bacterium OK074]|nr:(S)-2-hydroxy-acid oxidase [Actinobacteria bacterium OK074]